ncbi:MAG: RNA polymerase-binding protein RbpA, partial [Nocardioides sp.]|nr:RNA polymerase-binding protein RbpA [Nocardioides sp.]
MAGGANAIRGSRIGAGPMGESARGEAAPRQSVTYFCSHAPPAVVTIANAG